MSIPTRPVTILIAALGGEGGGVLANWIVAAAEILGYPVQSTSIPGVAQRTGATTYYIEIVPVHARELHGRRPVLALTPGIGDIDILMASELLEAGRAISGGFVTPDRTLVIASLSRSYVMDEKIAMGDGRHDQNQLIQAIADQSRKSLLTDLEALAQQSGAMINAVMLGALAGSAALPIPIVSFEKAIRDDGKAVEANLRGFRVGLAAARDGVYARPAHGAEKRRSGGRPVLDPMEHDIAAKMPAAAQDVMIEGVRRLAAYQGVKYASLYLDRLEPIRKADARAASGGRLLREVARHLAVRMSFEDVIRVAQAKSDPARMRRIAAELAVAPNEPFTVIEFLKPGIEELCQILPAWLARPILRAAARRGRLGRIHWAMAVKTTSISGYLRFRLLAKLRWLRPFGHRFRAEQSAIEAWLAHIIAAAELSPDLAIEIAECARLIKGYGDTLKRGTANYHAIETRVLQPALAGRIPVARAVDAVASARTAALLDPEGEKLAHCLDEIEARAALPIAAE
jgi:indolepyruvate ferredoxin oxidoreductase beta subunit